MTTHLIFVGGAVMIQAAVGLAYVGHPAAAALLAALAILVLSAAVQFLVAQDMARAA